MVDLEMTKSGDLKLSATEKLPSFQIDWYESEFPVFCLDWEQQEKPSAKPENDGLEITFNASNKSTELTKTVRPVRHEAELTQRLIILLRTELGDSALAPDLGTTMVLNKHQDICSMPVLKEIQSKILAAIDGLVENPSVVLKVEEKDGPFYCQNVGVYIYQNNDLVYQSSIGG